MAWTDFAPQVVFRFGGRIGRAQYWWGSIIVVALLVISMPVATFLVEIIPDDKDYLFYPICMSWFLLPFLCVMTTAIQRCHDRDKSAWWFIPFCILPATLGSLGDYVGQPFAFFIYNLAGLPALWATIELGCMRGTTGPNRYGPDPLGQPPLTSDIEPKSA